MSYSFRKYHRLLKKKSFQKVMSCDKKKIGSYIKIYYRETLSATPRLGITASSYFGNAIERNFFKRRIREIFRQHRLNFKSSLEIVIYPKKSVKNIPFATLKDEFLSLIQDI